MKATPALQSHSGEGDALLAALDDVADAELTAASSLDLAVDPDLARLEQPAGRSPGLDKVRQLQQLPEPDAPLTHLDVHGRDASARTSRPAPAG
jgi:hypothetical protein